MPDAHMDNMSDCFFVFFEVHFFLTTLKEYE